MVAPNAPADLVAMAASSSSIQLNWDDQSANETGFKVEQGDAVCENFVEITQTATDAEQHIVQNLQPETTYCFRVRAVNEIGNSESSNPATAQTLPVPLVAPTAPLNLAAQAASDTVINLNWNDTANNEEGFKVERGNAACVEFEEIAQLPPNTLQYSNEGLVAATP